MTFDPAATLVRYHTALDGKDLATVEKMLAPNARYVSVGIGDVHGRDAILESMRTYFANLPDQQAFDDEVAATGPRQAKCHWQLTATNLKTGAVVKRHGTEVIDFDDAGLIVLISVKDEG